jgi:hypothetical protein
MGSTARRNGRDRLRSMEPVGRLEREGLGVCVWAIRGICMVDVNIRARLLSHDIEPGSITESCLAQLHRSGALTDANICPSDGQLEVAYMSHAHWTMIAMIN